MKPRTRDNLIYVAVGVSVAALVVAQVFYAEVHGHNIVNASTFGFRAITSLFLVGYFAARAARRAKATFAQVVTCVLISGLLNVTISFIFRDAIERLPGLLYASLAALEIVLIVEMMAWVFLLFKRIAHP
jgi:hypothetical protein